MKEKKIFQCEVRVKGTRHTDGFLIEWTSKSGTAKILRENGYAVQHIEDIANIENPQEYIYWRQKTFDENHNLIDRPEKINFSLAKEIISKGKYENVFIYGMRDREFSIGNQPEDGLIARYNAIEDDYRDLIAYDRPLSDEEIEEYELDFLERETQMKEKNIFTELTVKGMDEEKKEKIPVEPTIKPMIETLEKLFEAFNEKFFDNELETPVITIAPDTCRAYGWFTTWRAWKETENKDAEGYYEINVTADYLDRDPVDIASTLLHEMVHLWNKMNDISDCSRGGKYHNKKFKIAAESHGLMCEKDNSYGFSQTVPTEKTVEFIKTLDLHFDLYRKKTSEKPTPDDEKNEDKSNDKSKTKRKSSTRKYVCPCCGAIIRATKEVNIICGDCKVPFELVEN